ncbi:electron transport complex subunit D [Clostridia bacterium]|nr:electron transport complex subunit D [Clostridia bacterium]
MTEKLYVSTSPHLRSGSTTQKIMLRVIIALIPALVASTIIFGARVLLVAGVTMATCIIAEYISRKVMKRNQTISDLSAIVTGLLLAMNLPVNINLFIAMFGSVVAIVVVKQMFGGIGQNFVNPAIAARIVLIVSFPTHMTTWVAPLIGQNVADAVSSATPLANYANGITTPYFDLFFGTTGGSLGETCAFAIIIGGIYLIAKKIISPIIPLVFIGTVAVMALVLGQDPLFNVLSGGVMLGAFFMATDYTTSPITAKGKVVFAIGCGVITMLIRLYANLPEGVSFSIILMNILVPHIEKLTAPKPFGTEKEKTR